MVLQSCTKVLHHIVLQDILKKLHVDNHQHGPQELEATVREVDLEVDLMSAPQCGVQYNTPRLSLASSLALSPTLKRVANVMQHTEGFMLERALVSLCISYLSILIRHT